MDDTDTIDFEMDVFLSPELAPHMNLVQYPIHDQDIGPPLTARVKPRHGILEADHATIDDSIRTYTSQTIPINTHLCLGKVVPGGTSVRLVDSVHLVPLSRILQMRPTFRHLETTAPDASYTPEETNRPVTFQRKESERAAAARKSSYQFKKRSEDEEDWCELQVLVGDADDTGRSLAQHDHTTTFPDVVSSSNVNRENYTEKTYCLDLENNVFQSSTSQAYVQSLDYVSNHQDGEGEYDNSSLSIEEVQANPKKALLFKLRGMLLSGVAVPFSAIQRKVMNADDPVEYDEEMILETLQEIAVMCRGNWCLLSKACIHLSDRLKRLRTFVLLLLEEDGVVHRDSLLSAYEQQCEPLMPEQVKTVLTMVGKLVPGGWKPKIEDDNEFIVHHREIAKHQRGFWQRQQERFAIELKAYRQHVQS